MTTKHCSILTNRGKALEAASAAGGAPVVLDGFVVGDGNGNAVTPEAGQTALVREVYRGTISRLAVSPDQENQFIAYLALPEGVGGFTVREAGLLTTDGELYAVGSCAAIEKPVNGVTATLQFRLAVAESAQVTLNVATGDGLFLRQDRNLSDVEDKDEAVENLGLKPTVDKAKNAVQRDGDTMSGDPEFATTVTKALAGKQPLNDVLTAVSQITPEENTLPYFSEEGRILLAQLSEKARALLALDTPEAMRTELELKAAATMEPQSDIRDRTPGRLALSGMHGFGQAFASADALAFEGLSDFVEWLKKVTPGRYAVSITDSSQLLTGTTQFNGIIDVMWSPYANSESDTVRKFKTLMCYNQYYQGEHCIHYMQYRYNDSDNSWNMSSRVVVYDGDSLAYLLSRMAGSGSYFKYPAVGVPVLAVYRGTTSGDKEIKIGLGDVVQGSQLGGVNLSCTISSAGPGSYGSTPSAGATGYTFPGRYMALSGVRDSYGTSGRICLFVRIE